MPADPVVHAPLRRSLRESAVLYLKGVAMGSSDLIPGVSGGTVALILGLYENLLRSLGTFTTRPFLALLRAGKIGPALRLADGGFLLAVVAGIATAIVILARPLQWLLENVPAYVDAVFFGLILASTLVVGRRVGRWSPAAVLGFLAAAAGAFVLVGLTPTTTPTGPLFLMLSGALAICALVLPGVSGAFVLVLLDKYAMVLAAIARFDVGVLVPLGVGVLLGLLSFVRLMAWLLRRYPAVTMAALTGFMLGSLRKVWPFGPDVAIPAGEPTGAGHLLLLLALSALGAVMVVLLERAGATRSD